VVFVNVQLTLLVLTLEVAMSSISNLSIRAIRWHRLRHAAVLTLVSPEAAERFPDIAGFKIFRIPLSSRS